MKTVNKLFAATILAAATSFSATANASIFQIDYHDVGIWNAYDSHSQTYSMKFRSDQGKDGFWLVATAGDNPKGDGTSHAILYGDLENNRITAYSYNGNNSSDSYTDGTLLGTYEGAFSSGGTHARYGYDLTMFSLDVSGINNALGSDFNGVELGEEAGIWFHQSAGSDFTYGTDGSILDYAFESQNYLDRGNDTTLVRNPGTFCAERPAHFACQTGTALAAAPTNPGGGSVPAPGGLALLLVGLAGLGRKFRKKA